jgi:transcriptional regulator with AAA-type ATPase domain/tetratricopeptide (TPR) repeat protein
VKVLSDIVGECSAIEALREQASEFLRRQSSAIRQPPILILGETGTGKGLLARALHQAGPRAAGPFIDVNCSAIPETMLEAELFGYERGAFTDARQAKVGLVQAAHTGTLFLDEIGLLPGGLQSKLLTVLEASAVRRLGSIRSLPVNVSIIAATNEDLSAAVQARRFREDLYHRLAVVTFTLPPLRERGGDVVLLAQRFLHQLCNSYGIPERSFANTALSALKSFSWPGNIRQLSNVIERTVLLSDSLTISAELLQLPSTSISTATEDTRSISPLTADEQARAELVNALSATSWNISRTAARLGLTRKTIRARIARYQIIKPTGQHHWSAPQAAPPAPVADQTSPDAIDAGPLVATAGSAPAPVSVRWDRRRVALLQIILSDERQPQMAQAESNEPLKVIVGKIRSFGGTVHDLSLGSIEASFGLAPIEDPTRRAAHAGLAIRRELASALQKRPSRMALHTCEVRVAYMGDAPQIDSEAKREVAPIMDELMKVTESGQMVASGHSAAFLRRRFVLQSVPWPNPGLAPHIVLGHEQFTVDGPEKRTRFVGRDEEFGLLQARLGAAVGGGRGHVVSVIGDPGVGKSRLVWEFTRSGQIRGARLLETASAYARTTPYLPVIDLLRRYFAIGADDDADRIRQRLDVGVSSGERSGVELGPLQALMGVPPPGWDTLDPVERRHHTLQAVKRLLLGESRHQPLIILFEDVHWIDSESQAILDAVVEGLPASRILLVVTHRPEYRHEWSTLSYYTQLNIGPLPSDSAGELLDGLLGTHASLLPVKRHLIEWTDGNPLFLEESVQALIETGALKGERGAYEAIGPTRLGDIPATIEDILGARIDRLSPRDKALLQSAAAIGTEVPLDVLSAVVDMSPETLKSGMRRLRAAELLHESSALAGNEVVFKHALTREVAYRSLLPEARRDLHRRITNAIETGVLDSGLVHIDRLARHAFQGEIWGKAAAYFRQAGDRAMGSAASREAAEYFEQALEALRRLPQSEQVRKDVIDLRLRMRDVFWLRLPASSILDHLRQADVLAESLRDRGRQAWIACYLCHYFWAVGDPEHALVEGERALMLALTNYNPAVLAETHFYRGIAQLALGDFRASVNTLTQTLSALEKAVAAGFDFPSRRFALHGPFILRSFLVRSHAELGEFAEAITRGEEALGAASFNPYVSAAISGGLGLVYVRKGEPARAIAILEPGLQLCRTYSLNNWIATVAGSLGAAYIGVGRVADGIALLQEAVDHGDRLGLGASNSVWVIFLGEGLLCAGRSGEAAAAAHRGLELCRTRKERGYEAWALRLLAEIAATGESPDRAEAIKCYEAAIAVGRERGMRPLIALCHLGLAHLDARAGDLPEAEMHRREAYTAFKELDMRPPGE